jgi:hypothetical protein
MGALVIVSLSLVSKGKDYVVTSLCHFWSLVHDGLWIYYADRPNTAPTHWRHKLAEHKYCEIIAWGVHHIPLPTGDEEQK